MSSTSGIPPKDALPSNHSIQGTIDSAMAKIADLSDYTDSDSNGNSEPSPSPSDFGTSLFSEVCGVFPSGNVLISPLSVHKALTLVKDGATAGSQTEAELKQVLGPPSMIEQTGDDPDVELSIATSIWADDLKPSYVEDARENYSAAAFPLPKRYTDIDVWIADETNHMIEGFMGDDKVPDDIIALLVNAVYFKGTWTYEFDPKDTADGEFVLRDQSKIPASFMSATRPMEYIHFSSEDGGGSAVILDYGKKSSDDEPAEFASVFILPADSSIDSMENVIAGLKSRPISDLLSSSRSKNVILKLPRFQLRQPKESLVTPLENMGMITAFDGNSDGKFDQMSNDPTVTVGDVFHGAVMEVTESGTKAAAATVVPMRNRSRPRPPPEMTFDRPFVVAVVHRPTGEPVFIGRVEVPVLDFD